jgi:hypothetical protein
MAIFLTLGVNHRNGQFALVTGEGGWLQKHGRERRKGVAAARGGKRASRRLTKHLSMAKPNAHEDPL